MSSFRDYWKAFWETLYEEWHGLPAPTENSSEESDEDVYEYNVGCVDVLIYHLDENNKLVSHMANLVGEIRDDEMVSAANKLDHWLKQAVSFGVYYVGRRYLIPRERVVKMVTTFNDFWISYEEDE